MFGSNCLKTYSQPDAGGDRFIIWGVGVLRHREGGDDGDRHQERVQGFGLGSGG